jgi:hypothetical protein
MVRPYVLRTCIALSESVRRGDVRGGRMNVANEDYLHDWQISVPFVNTVSFEVHVQQYTS